MVSLLLRINNNCNTISNVAVFLLSLLIVLLIQQPFRTNYFVVVEALPSGAAGCTCCAAAALGFHTDYGVGSTSGRRGDFGPLAEFNTTVIIHNRTMVPGNLTVFNGGVELSWMVKTGPDLPLRGVLFRVQPKKTTVDFTLTGDPNLQSSLLCLSEPGNVEGITHRTRVQKQNASGSMRFDQNGLVSIDVTVVYANGRVAPGDLSLYAYSNFELDIQNSPPVASAPTTPIPPPTKSPFEDRCVTNPCKKFFNLFNGRLYNRFRGGRCEERCSIINFFVLPQFGWNCGGCF
jgi:hypothetical protein